MFILINDNSLEKGDVFLLNVCKKIVRHRIFGTPAPFFVKRTNVKSAEAISHKEKYNNMKAFVDPQW